MRVILNIIMNPTNPAGILKLFIISIFLTQSINLKAGDVPGQVFEIRFENHRFTPQSLVIPAGRQVQIKVINSSAERIEFESLKLNREKVVEPGQALTMKLRPLAAGKYDFFDDFHADVPEGEILAR
jgi:heme/copper-type cytochrome/quinol oxidase subunit 2